MAVSRCCPTVWILVLAMMCGPTAWAGAADQPEREYRPAEPAVEDLVRDALRDRVLARNIPDIGLLGPDVGLLGKGTRILVLRELRKARLTLTSRALPELSDITFALIGEDEAQDRATREGSNVAYVELDRPQVTGDTATLWIGVDFKMPPTSSMVKMCCCASEGHFTRVEGRWRFVKWGDGRCH